VTRFDANTPEERRALIAATIAAHRERGSQFCTLEAATPPAAREETRAAGAGDGMSDTAPDASEGQPEAAESEALAASEQHAWVQFSDPEGVLNLDCTDAEYDRLVDVLDSFPEFTVQEQAVPEDADGRNLRIEARGDGARIADCVEAIFLEGYGYGDRFRLWATEL